ncbi:MAG: hypothetical protein QNJ12_08850 [Ilumatobacter sp.]|uniref:hypothetical protein n=1 Tax=Ilumatobacter sp. TaxID=1967498 RepID=UPI00263109D3|nr:hypothetical protein [Ilumatobacter sp.]MDJ0768889.1 hypothetical protein [Ilumatobacter sp.]
MDPGAHRPDVAVLTRAAERLDSLADTAELMGDERGADRFRAEARSQRLLALSLLDAASDQEREDRT